MILQHPYSVPTLTLTLPDPVLGDSRLINNPMINQMTMDGYVRSVLTGDQKYRLTYTFNTIIPTVLTALETFIDTSVGESIRLTDHNVDIWNVKLINNPLNTKQRSDGSCGLKTLTLIFEGTTGV